MNTAYATRTAEELKAEYTLVKSHFEDLKAKALKLNMARGKPGKEQLDLVSDILTVLQTPEDCVVDGLDVRNYGELTGLPCAKKLFAEILGCKPEECFIGGRAGGCFAERAFLPSRRCDPRRFFFSGVLSLR